MTMARSSNDMTAAILAGGLGTRLRSVVADRPKVLAGVNGRPFITRLLDTLVDAGMKRAILCTGYLGEQIEAVLGATYKGMELAYSRESSPLGTAGALRHALPLVRDNLLLVMNGDSYLQTDLAAFIGLHRAKGAACSMTLTRAPDTTRYGRVETDGNQKVLRFVEKGKARAPGEINAGIYIFDRRIIAGIARETEVSLEREVLPSLIGGRFYGFPRAGRFIDIGTPESYQEAEHFFAGITPHPDTFSAEENP